MIETVVPILGMTFVGIIMVCIGCTIGEYILLKNKDKEL